MSEHTHYEELAALSAGGHLSGEERTDLEKHLETCADCKSSAEGFRKLVHFGLPLTQSPLSRSIQMFMSRPDSGVTDRFIRRASLDGIRFSQDLTRPDRSRRFNPGIAAAAAGVLAAVVIAYFAGSHRQTFLPGNQQTSTQYRQQLDQLTQQNSALMASLSRQQRETENLRAQLATQTATKGDRPPNNNGQAAPSDPPGSQPLDGVEAQLQSQQKLLADTQEELARLKDAHASDQASLVADQIHINELSDQLKTVKANAISAQRQLLTVGGDVRNVMGARQLHVVDVRDTDANGKPSKPFGRIFLTEDKSLVFYAFDLNGVIKNNAKQTFQVWGQQTGKSSSPRSLGFLNVDNQAQGRWALKSTDPAALKGINTIFVTVEPQRGAKTPDGQRLLFAYLGEPNHP